MSYAIETFGLTKEYDSLRAVDELELKVERGCFYGFLGPNGAGKSTTIKMLTGLTSPTLGTANLLGFDLAEQPLEIKKRLGVVPEELCLFENLTGREYLTFIARMYQMPKKLADQRCDELLGLMELPDEEKKLVIDYSHGMKKKLSLAAALIHDPELLFLDEPFEGIDPIASRTIRNVLERLTQRESTIFLTSHIMEIVEKLCTHVGIIHQGKLVCQKPFSELEGTLESEFVKAVGHKEEEIVQLSWLEERENG